MRPSKVTTCAAPSHSISYLLVPDGAFPLPQQLQQQAGKEPGGQGAAGAAAGSGGRPYDHRVACCRVSHFPPHMCVQLYSCS